MENNNNDILRSLFVKTELEIAPAGFTSKVMQSVNKEAKEEVVRDSTGFLSPQYWMLIGAAFGLALIVIFSLDFSLFSGAGNHIDWKSISSIFSASVLNIKSFFSQIQISSTTIVIFGGLLSLFILDRLLNKRFSFNMFSF